MTEENNVIPPAAVRSEHTVRRFVTIFFAIALLVVGVLIGRASVLTHAPTQNKFTTSALKNSGTRPNVDFTEFWEIWNKIQTKFVHRPGDEQKMYKGAIAGMVASLNDPYSVYFTPEIAQQFQEELEGTFFGIGAEIGMKNNRVVIVTPLPDSPAEAAGIRAGDFIVAIDGKETTGFSSEEAAKRIRGHEGTTVTLAIERVNTKSRVDYVITRKKIELKSVTQKILPGDIMLMTVTSFNEQTIPQFNDAIAKVQEKKIKGIIVDLRNDPGGYFEGAIAFASEWLEPNQIVVAERGNGSVQRTEFSSNGLHRLRGIPTTVLINEGSASASEIVAGALQDHKVAKLIGQKSFGKGSVQEYEQLSDGSALKLTVALWFTPLDRSINESGIQPDIVLTEKKSGADDANRGFLKDPLKDQTIQRAVQFLRTGK